MHESDSRAKRTRPPFADADPDACGALLCGVAAGDPHAFEKLYRGQGPILLAAILRVVRNRSLAEEVLQDVFAEIWADCSRFDPDNGTGRGWLITICRRRAIDRVRSVQAQQDRDYTQGVKEAHASAEDVQRLALNHVESARAATALRELPKDQATAIALAYYQELTHAEIAAHLDVPLGTVKTRIRDGMKRLRAHLGVADGL